MKYLVLIVLLALLCTVSCKKTNHSSCDDLEFDCGEMQCIAHWNYFNFKIVDKTTGADLVFGPSPRYTTSDIKLFSDAARTIPLNIIVDDENTKLITLFGREEMYLEIAGTKTYQLTADFKATDCCSSRVKNLAIDGTDVCVCCNEVINIAID